MSHCRHEKRSRAEHANAPKDCKHREEANVLVVHHRRTAGSPSKAKSTLFSTDIPALRAI
jgi:hypothetical protein